MKPVTQPRTSSIDMDVEHQVDQLALLWDDVDVKTRAIADRIAHHRQACARHLEKVRPTAADTGEPEGPGEAEAADPPEDPHPHQLDAAHHARALRNLCKKMSTENSRIQQAVQMGRQAQVKLAARQHIVQQQQLLQLPRNGSSNGGSNGGSTLLAASSSSPHTSPIRRRGTAPHTVGGAPHPPLTVISPIRPHEHQQLEQLAALMNQKAQLTLQLELRDQKIAYQEAHISLLERELHARYDGSLAGSEPDDVED